MHDQTETIRRNEQRKINRNPSPKELLEEMHGVGNVWTTSELQQKFTVLGFMAPFCVVQRKTDGIRGSVKFQHDPRLYYSFEPE